MSNQSFPNKSDNQRVNHLQNESIPFSFGSPQQIAQWAAAQSSQYYPKPQTTPGLFVSAPSSSSSTTTSNPSPSAASTTTSTTTAKATSSSSSSATSTTAKPMTDFHAAALQAAQQGASGLQPPPAQAIDLATFKGMRFVTLDGCQLETREIYDTISGTFQWEMCESQDDRCMKFIREQCAGKRVFLITSGSLGRRVVPTIHDLEQIYAIYVYCADVPYNQEWACKYAKVRVVCNDDDKYLLPQLAVDVAQANIEWGDAFVKDGKRDKAKEKYQKALENLTIYAKRPDQTMVDKVNQKLSECK